MYQSRLLAFFLFLVSFGMGTANKAQAQYSTEHYIPPLYYHELSAGNDDTPVSYKIYLTTMVSSSFTVSITNGSGSNVASYSISKTSPGTHDISCNWLGDGQAECDYLYANQTGTSDGLKGLRLTASQPFYVRVDVDADPQGTSLSSKGSFAKGQEFYAAYFVHAADENTGNFISFMATENSTSVTVTPPSGCTWTGSTSVTLSANQSAVVANQDFSNNCIGTKVTSDKDIVVVSGSWSGRIGNNSANGRDMGVDQLIPASAFGTHYLIHEGYPSAYPGAKAIVVAKEANTQVSVNGALQTTLAAQDWYERDLNNSLDAITANKDITVYFQGYPTSNKSASKNQDFMVLAPIEDTNSAGGSTHAHLADMHHLYDSSDGNVSYYILTQDNNVGVTFDNSSTTLTSFASSPVLNRTLNGTTWYLYRRVEQAAPSTDYNVSFESNSGTPIHVWAGFGKNLEGAYANFSAFKSPNTDTDTDGDGVSDSSDTDPNDANVCADADGDGCDDCAVTGANGSGGSTSNDGTDTDGDGQCDAGDDDDDNDGVDDVIDNCVTADFDLSADVDADGCDDADEDTDDDNDGVIDDNDSCDEPVTVYSDPFNDWWTDGANQSVIYGDGGQNENSNYILSGSFYGWLNVQNGITNVDIYNQTFEDLHVGCEVTISAYMLATAPTANLNITVTDSNNTELQALTPALNTSYQQIVMSFTATTTTADYTIHFADTGGNGKDLAMEDLLVTQFCEGALQADFDADGCDDTHQDNDDDNDGVDDSNDDCATADFNLSADFDGDGCDDADEDTDDDNDGVDDSNDDCATADFDLSADFDGDGCDDADEDNDDDNDGVDDDADDNDNDPNICSDTDGDSCDDCAVTGPSGSGADPANDGTDTDGDGICDAGDSDSDNDGILDTDECDYIIADGSFEAYTPDGPGLGGSLPNWFNWNEGTPDLNQQGGYEAPWFSFQTPVSGDNYIGIVNLYDAKEGLSQDLSSVIASGTNITWSVWAASGEHNISVYNIEGTVTLEIWGNANTSQTATTSSGVPTGAVLIDEIDITGTEMTLYESAFTAPFDIANITISIRTGVFSGIMVDDFFMSLNDSGVFCDTDNDGISNNLDTDSDGDGCSDALEAGFTDADADGQVDGTGVDADGLVTGGDGYTTPADSDTSGTPDHLEDTVSVACAVDADGDGVFSDVDNDDSNPNVCADADGDGCDDCAVTGANGSGGSTSNDGTDTDGDGQCDVGDPDDDNDGVNDGVDSCVTADFNLSADVDGDGDMDVLSASFNDGKVIWYENRPFPDIGAVEQEYRQPLPEPKRLTLTPETIIHDATFADVALPGTISGTHFLDLDRDGVQDEGEIGISQYGGGISQNGGNGEGDGQHQACTTKAACTANAGARCE